MFEAPCFWDLYFLCFQRPASPHWLLRATFALHLLRQNNALRQRQRPRGRFRLDLSTGDGHRDAPSPSGCFGGFPSWDRVCLLPKSATLAWPTGFVPHDLNHRQFGMAPKWGTSILYLFWPTKWTFACSSNSFNLRDWSYFFAMLTLACLTIGNSLALPCIFDHHQGDVQPWGSGLILIALEPLDLLFPCAKTPCSLARTEEGGSLSNTMGGLSYWSGVLFLIPVGHSWFIITVK